MMAGVSHGDADRAGHPGVADPQRPDLGSGHRDGGRRGDGAGPGAGKAGQGRVGGQAGDRGQLGDRQQARRGGTGGR